MRRGGVRAGPLDPRPGAGPPGRPQAQAGPELPLHHARHRGGAAHSGPHHRDEQGPHRRERHLRRGPQEPEGTVHEVPYGGRPQDRQAAFMTQWAGNSTQLKTASPR